MICPTVLLHPSPAPHVGDNICTYNDVDHTKAANTINDLLPFLFFGRYQKCDTNM
jgi:hypothetical protein